MPNLIAKDVLSDDSSLSSCRKWLFDRFAAAGFHARYLGLWHDTGDIERNRVLPTAPFL